MIIAFIVLGFVLIVVFVLYEKCVAPETFLPVDATQRSDCRFHQYHGSSSVHIRVSLLAVHLLYAHCLL